MSEGNSPGGTGEQGVTGQGPVGGSPAGPQASRPYWGPDGPDGTDRPAEGHGYGVPPSGGPSYGGPPDGGEPAGYGAPFGSHRSPPPTYLPWGIAAIIGGVLFSLIGGVPTGLASAYFARKVIPRWQAGDQQGALDASRKARTWAIVSTVLDVLGFIFVVYLISNSRNGTVS